MTSSQLRCLIILFGFIVFIICGTFSNGYYHFDEHYQIIEFAQLKSGINLPGDLAWEYRSEIRPALQPLIAYTYLYIFRALGVDDPYILMALLRVLTAILSVCIILYFVKKTEHYVNKEFQLGYLSVALFLWMTPFINVRFSSETYSGLSLTLATALVFSKRELRFFLIGVLIGVAFWFRFQTAFMSIGLILWIVFIQKISLKNINQILVGGVIMLIAGFIIDYWFYGHFTITFYNYYFENIINGVASGFGISPWTYYFKEVVLVTIYPVGIIIWFSLMYQTFFNYKNLAIWIVIPFIVIHCIIPHKELRFLMPIINFLPLLILLTFQDILKNLELRYELRKAFLIICAAIVVPLNAALLLITIFSPADQEGRMNITSYIKSQYKSKRVDLWIINNDNPYNPISIKQNFYINNRVKIIEMDLSMASGNYIFKPDSNVLLCMRKDRLDQYSYLFREYELTEIKVGIYSWIDEIRELLDRESKALILYRVKPK